MRFIDSLQLARYTKQDKLKENLHIQGFRSWSLDASAK